MATVKCSSIPNGESSRIGSINNALIGNDTFGTSAGISLDELSRLQKWIQIHYDEDKNQPLSIMRTNLQ